MVTIYHLNHGSPNFEPGQVFDLQLIDPPQGEHYDSYESWRQGFPNGLSRFGWRHMTPEHSFQPVPEWKVELEARCEQVRQSHFPCKRSRYQAFFGVATLEEAIAFRDGTKAEMGITGSIWKVTADHIFHRGDMRLLTEKRGTLENLLAYWEGRQLEDGGTPIWECLVVPPVTMVCCVFPDDTSVS